VNDETVGRNVLQCGGLHGGIVHVRSKRQPSVNDKTAGRNVLQSGGLHGGVAHARSARQDFTQKKNEVALEGAAAS
jgi:preprotein translocase subunit YajC